MCTLRQTGNTQLAPVAQSLGSSPEASGRSLQISALGSRTAWAATPHLQVLQEDRGAPERLAGRNQCVLVSPACPGRSLQVSALGSEQPGPQHLVSRKCKRPGVHPEADWEHTACSGGSAPQSLGSSPESSGRSLQISTSGYRTAWATRPHLQALQEARGAPWRGAGRSQCALVSPAGPRQEPSGLCFQI